MSGEEVEFVLGSSKYDQATFSGRFRHFLDVIDPRLLFTSNKKLEHSVDLLKSYEDGSDQKASNSELWNAQKVKQAIVHPDTQEKVPIPFRMSGFVPFGSPIVVGMLIPTKSLLVTSFWQWLNQSHNACVNYCNRNASQETSMTDFLTGYVGAVTSAVGIAVGIQILIRKSTHLKPATQTLIRRLIPFPATATASVCNVVLMRKKELSTGIQVNDVNSNVVGVSKVAARKALQETALTRFFLPMPILLVPPAVMAFVEKKNWYKKHMARYSIPFQACVVLTSFFIALPLAIALFPQYSKIRVDQLESEVQKNTDEEFLYYNKGL